MINLGETPNLIKNYLKEIKESIRSYDKKPKLDKLSTMNKVISQMKKDLHYHRNTWQKSFHEISEEIDKDTSYTNFLKLEKAVKERIKTCLIINVINFSICPSTNVKSVYEDNLSKDKAKKILKNFKTKTQSNKKQIIVNEDDYEFSDDSIDYSISPVANNTNISDETTKLEEILSSVKTKSDITNLIKKSVGSKPVKLKIRLEKDMKSILLMMKFLNISS
jgi:hypothetical protein